MNQTGTTNHSERERDEHARKGLGERVGKSKKEENREISEGDRDKLF